MASNSSARYYRAGARLGQLQLPQGFGQRRLLCERKRGRRKRCFGVLDAPMIVRSLAKLPSAHVSHIVGMPFMCTGASIRHVSTRARCAGRVGWSGYHDLRYARRAQHAARKGTCDSHYGAELAMARLTLMILALLPPRTRQDKTGRARQAQRDSRATLSGSSTVDGGFSAKGSTRPLKRAS
jgi:hypothetical protein